jgi:lysine/ornithine N-monooxygenase
MKINLIKDLRIRIAMRKKFKNNFLFRFKNNVLGLSSDSFNGLFDELYSHRVFERVSTPQMTRNDLKSITSRSDGIYSTRFKRRILHTFAFKSE